MILIAAEEHAEADHELKSYIMAAAGIQIKPRRPARENAKAQRAGMASRIKGWARAHNAALRSDKKRRASQDAAARAKVRPAPQGAEEPSDG